jgi:hypothetical protein
MSIKQFYNKHFFNGRVTVEDLSHDVKIKNSLQITREPN